MGAMTSALHSEVRRLLGIAILFVFRVVVLMPIPLLLLVLIIVFRISSQYVKDGRRRID
jgi:hypothetical protein